MSENKSLNSRLLRPGMGNPRPVPSTDSPSKARITASPVARTNSGPASQYEVAGPGLDLCLPNKLTSFIVKSCGNRKVLKVADLKVTIKGAAVAKHTVKERTDGSLEVSYTAPMSGEYKITLAVGPQTIPGSPFKVLCQVPRACETCSVLDLNGGYGFAGEVYTARLICKDQYGQAYTGKVDVVANIMDGSTVIGPAEVHELCPGEYSISFLPEISALYGLAVVLDGSRALSGSPYQVKVRSDETIPAKCKVFGAQLNQGIAGKPIKFTIQAMDGKNNARLIGGDQFSLEVAGPHGAQIKKQVKDNMNGTYDIIWSTDLAGMYLLKPVLEEAVVGNGPVNCYVSASDLKPANCTCSGPGLRKARAGQPAEFKIAAADAFGNTRSTGGDAFQVHVHSAGSSGRGAPLTGIVDDNGDGTYKARFTLNVAGQYDIHVTHADTKQPVKGSPFHCTVEAGMIDPRSSRIYGPGLQAVQLGRQSQILVELADKWGNKVYAYGSFDPTLIHIDVRGPGPVVVAPGPLQDGVQTYTYIAKQAGSYTISATVDGQHLCDSPATVVASTSAACAEMCEVRGTPLDLQTTAGSTADVYIVAKDAKGVQKSLGGDIFGVQWERTDGQDDKVTGKVEDLGTGEYRTRFFATAAGAYKVAVTFGGKNIAGSPFTAVVKPAVAEAAFCVAQGPGMHSAKAGSKATFSIKPRDKYANTVKVSNANLFDVRVTGPAPAEVVLKQSEEDMSEVQASYIATVAGEYMVHALYKNENVDGSPWRLVVDPDCGKAMYSRYLEVPVTFTAGVEACVSALVHDVHANATHGGDHVLLELDSVAEGMTTLTGEDVGAGVYRVKYTPTKSGFITLRLLVNDELVDEPHTIPVQPASLVALMPVTAGPWTCTAGERAVFLVHGKDEFGNAVQQGGANVHATVVTVSDSGEQSDTPASVQDNGDGTYSVACVLQHTCQFKVNVRLGGNNAVSTCFDGHCEPAALCPAKSHLLKIDDCVAAGEEGCVQIVRCDKFGNKLCQSGNPSLISATGTGPDNMRVVVADQTDGSVKLKYTARKAGTYKLACSSSVSGEQFCNGPWTVTVQPAAVLAENCEAQLMDVNAKQQVTAGRTVGVRLIFKDTFGNQVSDITSVPVCVRASGPEEVTFTNKQPGIYSGTLTKSGTYLVHASVGNTVLSGWPKLLHVLADASDAKRCYLTGEPESVKVGDTVTMLVHTVDCYGNIRGQGSEQVSAQLHGPAKSGLREARIVDNDNGTYFVHVKVDRPGKWLIKPRVNGAFIGADGGYELEAAPGALTATEYILKHLPEAAALAGSTSSILLTTKLEGVMVTGDELLSATLASPDGHKQHIPLRLLEDKSGYQLPVSWWVTGTHSLSVSMQGKQVLRSPATIEVAPAAMDLPSCLVQGNGLRSCKAGDESSFTVAARDAFGNSIAVGGAKLEVKVTDAAGTVVDGAVKDNRDGTYEAVFTLTRAGSYSVQLGSPGTSSVLKYEGTCYPAKCNAARCVPSKPTQIVAGEYGEMSVLCKDRFGNTVKARQNAMPLIAETGNNSALAVSCHETSEGHMVFRYSSTLAGSHSFSIIDPATKAALPGSPFSVEVAPGEAYAPRCTAAIARDGANARAGDTLVVTYDLKDAHGNVVRKSKPGAQLAVHAVGPAVLDFELSKTGNMTAIPTAVGLYTIFAEMEGTVLTGWPKTVTVQPGMSSVATCRLVGDALLGMQCLTPAKVGVLLYDEHGNQRQHSNDTVELLIVDGDDKAVTVPATDAGAGVFTAKVAVNKAGIFRLVPKINGHIMKDALKEVAAAWGPITGADCVLSEPSCSGKDLPCGDEVTYTLRPKQAKQGRTFSGHEAVAVSITAPSGKSYCVPVMLNDHRHYVFNARTQMAGQYSFHVCVSGEPVPGSPFSVVAVPADVDLQACKFSGHGLDSCVAGLKACFEIRAGDRFGNTLSSGGASFKVSVRPTGKDVAAVPATVEDKQDGTYAVSYAVKQAGPLAISVELPGSKSVVLHTVCVAGAAVGRACQVASYDDQLVAGRVGYMKVTLADRFGNRIHTADSTSVSAVVTQGSKPLLLKAAEQQDGSVLISYCPTAAGLFTLQLSCGEGEDALIPGSYAVDVVPAAVSISRCKATIEGMSNRNTIVAGQQLAIAVVLSDALGNTLPTTSDVPVVVEATAPTMMPFECSSSGMYRQSFSTAGTYLLSASVAGQQLHGWPMLLSVLPDATDGSRCSLTGAMLQGQLTVGRPAQLLLQTRDTCGNNRTEGGDAVEFTATSGECIQQGSVVDNGDGTYRLEVTVSSAGQWLLKVAVNGHMLYRDGCVVNAVLGPLLPSELSVRQTSANVVCGSSDDVLIKPVNGRTVSGHEHVTAFLTCPSGAKTPLPVSVCEGCQGFAADISWREAGPHMLSVFMDGQHVTGSPVQYVSQPGEVLPQACAIAHYRNSSDVVELTVEGRDAFNNPCQLQPELVRLHGMPSSCLEPAAAVAAADGCAVRLSAAVVGKGHFNVQVAGHPIFATDRAVQCDGVQDVTQVLRPVQSGTVQVVAGTPTSVLVALTNASGQPALCAELLDARGAVLATPAVQPRDDGLFEVPITCNQVGEYVLHSSVTGVEGVSCQVKVKVSPAPVCAGRCQVTVKHAVCTAGAAARVLIQRMDTYDNKSDDVSSAFTADVSGPGPALLESHEIGGGLLEYSMKARTAGSYRLQVALQSTGEVIAGAPVEIQVCAGSPSGCCSSYKASGFTGKQPCTVTAGQEVLLLLDVRDRYGNVAPCAASAVTAAAHGPQGVVRFAWKDGCNTLQPTLAAVLTVAGPYQLEVMLLDESNNQWGKIYADSMRSQVVVQPTVLSNAHTTFSELPATLSAGIPVELFIQPTDKYGNKGARGGSFIVQLYDGKEVVPCAVTQGAEATAPIVAKIVAMRTGSFKVRAIVAKDDVKELLHAVEVKVVEAATCAETSYILGHWPPSGPVANIAAGFLIQACDKHGNMLTKGGSRFNVDIMGLPSQSIQVMDRGDGQYNVQYIIPGEGSYRVNVTLDGKHIQGSPTSLSAFRDIVGMANKEMEKCMASTVTHLRRGIVGARQDYALLKAEAASLEQFIPVLIEGTRNGIYEALKQQDSLLAETRQAYQREALERRRLHNLVQELRGNIRVYVRVKPLTPEEEQSGMLSVVKCDDHRITCTTQGGVKTFDYDRTFGPETTQGQVFEDVAQLVTSALDGYNVCIFAYGQTGAGKTYTMEGTPDNPGINYRTVRELFRSIEEEHTADYSHEITASIVEIYNEEVRDLLAQEGKKECELQRTANGFDVVGLTEVDVDTPEHIFTIMEAGFEHRATGCHDVNAHSSRSHCLLIINVRVENRATGITTCGKLTLCDLAGSERINKTHATGLTLTEAQNINKSLLELGNVISALMQQAQHVPYRNSKLTMLLQDSLGGDSKALMFANVSPASVHVSETMSSLAFAAKVGNVVLKTPQKKFEETPQQGAAAAISAAHKRMQAVQKAGKQRSGSVSNIPSLAGAAGQS